MPSRTSEPLRSRTSATFVHLLVLLGRHDGHLIVYSPVLVYCKSSLAIRKRVFVQKGRIGSARKLSDLDRQGLLVPDIQVLVAQEHDSTLRHCAVLAHSLL